MNRQEIISLIKEPAVLNSNHQNGMKVLAEKFPYSGIVQALYAKTLHNCDDILFNDQLKTAAIVCSDRKKLYQLIHQNKLKELISNIEEEINEPSNIEITTDQLSVEKKLPTETKEVTEETLQKEKTQVKEISDSDSQKDSEFAELEKNILAQAINASILLEVPEHNENEELVDTEENHPQEEEKIVTPKTKFSNWFGSSSASEKEPVKSKDTTSIIESFLNKEKPAENKTEFFSPTNIAKISLVDNEEFVTETLANVYAAQGNFEKAIRIYERLSLINPEKNTFFASRIRFLKEKLDNKRE